MSATGESLRAMSDSRNWYARQSQMTVFGTVPSLHDVQQNFSDCLAMAVGLLPRSPSSQLPNPSPAGRASSLTEVK